jgi:hypothetical protein
MAVNSRRKLLTVSLPFAAIAILLAALAVEAWVRMTWDPRKGRPGFFLTDPIRGQRLAAGYEGWFAGVPVKIDRLELRDPREYSLQKGPHTFRILVLGDSVTFGHGAVYEQTYPRLLEDRLRAWQPTVDWQVWNAAVPGYNTSQELAHLLEVGDRFQPDLVIVGFFFNDLFDNRPLDQPGRASILAADALAFARRHFFSFEFYKRVYLTARWRWSRSKEDRLRAEHADDEQQLLAADTVTPLSAQRLTPFERFTDDQVRQLSCVDGMKANPNTVPAMQRDPGYGAWVDAVRGFQRLARDKRFRIVFFLNDAPAVCGTAEDEDFFYDGGTRAVDRFYASVLGDGLPTVSSYDAFMHTRPSQMPGATAHSFGNANVVKADVLFEFLRDRILPPLVDSRAPGRTP